MGSLSTPPGSATSVSGLTDVNLDSLGDGQVLKWDGSTSKWIPTNMPEQGITSIAMSDISDVGAVASDGQILQYNQAEESWLPVQYISADGSLNLDGQLMSKGIFVTTANGELGVLGVNEGNYYLTDSSGLATLNINIPTYIPAVIFDEFPADHLTTDMLYEGETILFQDSADHKLKVYENGSSVLRPVATFGSVPSNATDTGTPGDVAYDTDYMYVCIATDTWKRTPLSTW